MRSDQIAQLAVHRCAEALRTGAASPYDCLRFLENNFRYPGADHAELLRRAVMVLVRHDPLLLITSPFGSGLDGLSDEDVQQCIDSWSLEDAPLAALLEAHLWMAVSMPRHPDSGRAARALAALDRAEPRFRGDARLLELRVAALKMIGDARYPAAVDALLDATPPEWRAHAIHDAMRDVVASADWNRYDELRGRWAQLPQNAYVCECSHNFVANIDGLRALQRGDEQEAVRCLRRAVSVGGCAHLNSGGACLELARCMLDRGVAVAELMNHVEAVERYRVNEATSQLRKRVAERMG